MADDSRQPAGRAADLARVRDNQRRSRARRKEYLQELEIKYRTCEQVGIGASAELQAAARQVANENRRLRQLLTEHGIPAHELDAGGDDVSPVANLEAVLGKNRPCGDWTSCETSSLAAVRPDYDATLPERGLRPLQMRSTPPSGHDSSGGPSPISVLSSTSNHNALLPSPYTPSTTTTTTHSIENMYAQLSPVSLYDNYQEYAPALSSDTYHHHHHHNNNNNNNNNNNTTTTTTTTSSDNEPHPHSQHTSTYQHMTPQGQAPAQAQHSSCRDIADAILYVRPNLSQQELEQEMGCRPGTVDCHVPNYEAFDLMDRLSERGSMMRR